MSKLITGNRYKVTQPTFTKAIGQGNPPDGFSFKNEEGAFSLEWGTSFEAAEMAEMLVTDGLKTYVRTDIVERLLSAENPVIKLTRRASKGE